MEGYGWHFVNHSQLGTVEKYGDWFPIILDSVILSSGKGFLGVVYSTSKFSTPLTSGNILLDISRIRRHVATLTSCPAVSLLAYRRTIEWNSGVGRMIEPNHVVPEYWQWPWHVV